MVRTVTYKEVVIYTFDVDDGLDEQHSSDDTITEAFFDKMNNGKLDFSDGFIEESEITEIK